MNIRAYQPSDRDSVNALHAAMALDYRMIDLDGPMVVAKTVCEVAGEVVAAAALKMQAETYLWVSPSARPAAKWDAIRLMQREILRQALRIGIEQMVAYVPDCVGRFSKRLLRLGWQRQRDGWRAWSLEVKQ